MNELAKIFAWIQANQVTVGGILTGLYGIAEVIFRLFPKAKDDTLLERLGKIIQTVMDVLKIPNNGLNGVDHPPLTTTEQAISSVLGEFGSKAQVAAVAAAAQAVAAVPVAAPVVPAVDPNAKPSS